MSTSTTAAAAQPGAPGQPTMSEGARLVNVFFSPSETFADINRRPSWWLPWLVLALVTIAATVTLNQKIGASQLAQNMVANNPKLSDQFDKMPADQKEIAMSRIEFGMKYGGYINIVVSLLMIVVIGAVLMGTFNFGFGTEIPFRTSMSIVAYSYLPLVLSSLLMIVVVFVISPDAFNIENPVMSNLGMLVSQPDHPAIWRLLVSLDLFNFWVIFLLGTGYAAVSKVKKGTAIMTVFTWYMLIELARVAWAAI